MAKQSTSNKFLKRFRISLQRGLRFSLIVFLGFLTLVILKGLLKKEGLVIQAISTPKVYQEAGFHGGYIAHQLESHISKIYDIASSVRGDSLKFNVNDNSDLDMNVMGIGISASNIIYHLRDLLNIQTNYVTGNISDLDQQMTLFLNLDNPFNQIEIKCDYWENDRIQTLDSILFEGAKFILDKIDPYILAVYYHNINEDQKTLDIVRSQINDRNESKWFYNLWANIEKGKDRDNGLKLYKQALQIDPNFALAHQNIAWMYFQMDSLKLAQDHFEKAFNQDNRNFGVVNGLAQIHLRFGNIEKAKEYYETNIKNFPNWIWSYMNYASQRSFINDSALINQIFDKARKNIKDRSEYASICANYELHIQGDTLEAMKYFEEAIFYNPNHVPSLMGLAGHYYGITEFEKCIVARRKLIDLLAQGYDRDMQVSNLNMLAMAKYQVEEYDSSRFYIRQAITLDDSNPFPYTTLAESYSFEGNHDQFFEHITTAVQLGFDVRRYLNEEPYKRYKESPRMKALIQTIEEKENKDEFKG